MFKKKSWSTLISEVFNTLPRDGSLKSTVWLERKELERKLESELASPGVHVCIDGPTGTGKSSLSTTMLNRRAMPYRLIQVTKSMTWTDFCYRIIREPKSKKSTVQANVEIGINRGLPTGLLKVALGKSKSSVDDYELRVKISKTITEDVICELMAEHNIALLIDDFERASKAIMQRVSDMCKLLTESYVSENAKLIIVGTDDIYSRLTTDNLSLEERLIELSIGTLAEKNESWRFLLLGFDKLQLENPATLYNKKYISKDELLKCVQTVHEAVDGLPKSLNVLGREIAKKAREDRKRISVADVIKTAIKVPEKNIRKFSYQFPEILNCAKSNPIVREVLQYLYRVGIGQIHRLADVISHLEKDSSEEQVRNAIGVLINLEFLTQTGFNKDVLFVTNPTLAHTLGVVSANPHKYNAPKAFLDSKGQLSLPLFSDLGIKR